MIEQNFNCVVWFAWTCTILENLNGQLPKETKNKWYQGGKNLKNRNPDFKGINDVFPN